MDEFTVSLGFTVSVRARRKVITEDDDEAIAVARAKMDEIVNSLREHCADYEIKFESNGIVVY